MQISLLTKQKRSHRLREETYSYKENSGRVRGIGGEFGMDMYAILSSKIDTQQDLPNSTGKMYRCMCM